MRRPFERPRRRKVRFSLIRMYGALTRLFAQRSVLRGRELFCAYVPAILLMPPGVSALCPYAC